MHTHSTRPRIIKAKSRAQRDALRRLNTFLDTNNPKLVRILVRTWEDQQAAITYKELREAFVTGSMTADAFRAWENDYAVFFNNNLKGLLTSAATTGGQQTLKTLLSSIDLYTPMSTGIDNWITVHGAEWITQMSTESQEAVSAMIDYAAKGNITVDELSRITRATIGLTQPQSIANAKYYETVKANLKEKLLTSNPKMKETTAEKQAAKRAQESAARYAARQHRERAMMIAETELAYAYNKGADEAVQQAVDEGLLPKMRPQWSTAADEDVCSICAALDGVQIDLGGEFNYKGKTLYSGQKKTPPAHPRCRCALCYIEAE